MAVDMQAILKLPAVPVASVLEALWTIRQKSNKSSDVQVPLTTIFLKSGQTVIGWLLNLAREKDAVLFTVKTPAPLETHVLYVSIPSIEAILVQDMLRVAPDLSFGAVAGK